MLATGCGAFAFNKPTVYPTFANVPYAGPNSSAAQTLDVYTQNSSTPVPLVVFIHGGGWSGGDKSAVHGILQLLLSHGFAVASINYRLTHEAHWPAQINDVKAAIRYLRANAAKGNIDPNRIGVWGMSAGGHLAALLGTSGDIKELEGPEGPQDVSSRVQSVVDWYGPTDFTVYSTGQENLGANVEGIVTRLFNGKITERHAEAKAASPKTYISADDPPMLIMHGTRDPLVPLEQSTEFARALRKAGDKDVTMVVIPNAGHIMFAEKYLEQVVKFFKRTLAAPKTAPSSLPAAQLQTP